MLGVPHDPYMRFEVFAEPGMPVHHHRHHHRHHGHHGRHSKHHKQHHTTTEAPVADDDDKTSTKADEKPDTVVFDDDNKKQSNDDNNKTDDKTDNTDNTDNKDNKTDDAVQMAKTSDQTKQDSVLGATQIPLAHVRSMMPPQNLQQSQMSIPSRMVQQAQLPMSHDELFMRQMQQPQFAQQQFPASMNQASQQDLRPFQMQPMPESSAMFSQNMQQMQMQPFAQQQVQQQQQQQQTMPVMSHHHHQQDFRQFAMPNQHQTHDSATMFSHIRQMETPQFAQQQMPPQMAQNTPQFFMQNQQPTHETGAMFMRQFEPQQQQQQVPQFMDQSNRQDVRPFQMPVQQQTADPNGMFSQNMRQMDTPQFAQQQQQAMSQNNQQDMRSFQMQNQPLNTDTSATFNPNMRQMEEPQAPPTMNQDNQQDFRQFPMQNQQPIPDDASSATFGPSMQQTEVPQTPPPQQQSVPPMNIMQRRLQSLTHPILSVLRDMDAQRQQQVGQFALPPVFPNFGVPVPRLSHLAANLMRDTSKTNTPSQAPAQGPSATQQQQPTAENLKLPRSLPHHMVSQSFSQHDMPFANQPDAQPLPQPGMMMVPPPQTSQQMPDPMIGMPNPMMPSYSFDQSPTTNYNYNYAMY